MFLIILIYPALFFKIFAFCKNFAYCDFHVLFFSGFLMFPFFLLILIYPALCFLRFSHFVQMFTFFALRTVLMIFQFSDFSYDFDISGLMFFKAFCRIFA